MIDINDKIKKVRTSRYGIDVRDSIADGLQGIQDGVNDAINNLSGGSAPTAAALSVEALTATVGVATKVDDTDYVTEG